MKVNGQALIRFSIFCSGKLVFAKKATLQLLVAVLYCREGYQVSSRTPMSEEEPKQSTDAGVAYSPLSLLSSFNPTKQCHKHWSVLC